MVGDIGIVLCKEKKIDDKQIKNELVHLKMNTIQKWVENWLKDPNQLKLFIVKSNVLENLITDTMTEQIVFKELLKIDWEPYFQCHKIFVKKEKGIIVQYQPSKELFDTFVYFIQDKMPEFENKFNNLNEEEKICLLEIGDLLEIKGLNFQIMNHLFKNAINWEDFTTPLYLYIYFFNTLTSKEVGYLSEIIEEKLKFFLKQDFNQDNELTKNYILTNLLFKMVERVSHRPQNWLDLLNAEFKFYTKALQAAKICKKTELDNGAILFSFSGYPVMVSRKKSVILNHPVILGEELVSTLSGEIITGLEEEGEKVEIEEEGFQKFNDAIWFIVNEVGESVAIIHATLLNGSFQDMTISGEGFVYFVNPGMDFSFSHLEKILEEHKNWYVVINCSQLNLLETSGSVEEAMKKLIDYQNKYLQFNLSKIKLLLNQKIYEKEKFKEKE